MSESVKRTASYLDPDLHHTLRLEALHTGRSMTDLVNEAVRVAFREDQEDLAAFDQRDREPEMSDEVLLKNLKSRGKIRTFLQEVRGPGSSGPAPAGHPAYPELFGTAGG